MPRLLPQSFFVLCLPGLALSSADHFEIVRTVEERLSVARTVPGVRSLALCSAFCAQMGKDCEGFRFNVSNSASNDCLLGTYEQGDDFEFVFRPGDVVTYWKVEYSENGCFVRHPVTGTPDAMIEFCARIGGRLPEFRRPGDEDQLLQLGWSILGLRRDDSDVWRWASDGAAAAITQTAGDTAGGKCARVKTEPTFLRISCGTRYTASCQIC